MNIPELVSPAGSLKNMRYAFAYGADAVYAGQPKYSLRVRNNEFDYKKIKIGIKEAHKIGKKFYVVINIAAHNNKIKNFIDDIKNILKLQPDAFIMSDPGLIILIKENFPEIKIHLSVQANTVNWAAVKFWKNIGLKRIILSRELSIEEIKEIRQRVPDIELEIFVHGSLCIAYSGRCLLSNYINKRDSNQGACTNSCRWKYKIKEKNKKKDNFAKKYKKEIIKNFQKYKEISIKNTQWQKEYMPIFEDQHGSYILNSKDLRAIEHIKTLTNIGINAFKIEGRTKSFYYCAKTAQAYKKAINDAIKNKPFNLELLKSLDCLANRGYTQGFLNRHIKQSEYQNYNHSYSISKNQQLVGEFTGKYKNKLAEVKVINKFQIGDKLELISPIKNIRFVLNSLKDENQKSIQTALGNGYIVYLDLFEKIKLKFAILTKKSINR